MANKFIYRLVAILMVTSLLIPHVAASDPFTITQFQLTGPLSASDSLVSFDTIIPTPTDGKYYWRNSGNGVSGLKVTTDDGQGASSWTTVQGDTTNGVQDVSISSDGTHVYYALGTGSNAGTLRRSINSGSSFSNGDTALNVNGPGILAWIATDTLVWVTKDNANGKVIKYVSTDDGLTFGTATDIVDSPSTQILYLGQSLSDGVIAFYIASNSVDDLAHYLDIMYSTDGGVNWNTINLYTFLSAGAQSIGSFYNNGNGNRASMQIVDGEHHLITCISLDPDGTGVSNGFTMTLIDYNIDTGTTFSGSFGTGGVNVARCDAKLTPDGYILAYADDSGDSTRHAVIALMSTGANILGEHVFPLYSYLNGKMFQRSDNVYQIEGIYCVGNGLNTCYASAAATYYTTRIDSVSSTGNFYELVGSPERFSTINVNYNSPENIYGITFGGDDVNDVCFDGAVSCASTVRLNTAMSALNTGEPCTPQTFYLYYTDYVSPVGLIGSVTTDNKYYIECSSSNDGTTSNYGWGLYAVTEAMGLGTQSMWDPQHTYLNVLKTDSTNLNNVYLLLENGDLLHIDLFTQGLSSAQKIKQRISVYPAQSFDVSKSGNGLIAVPTKASNTILLYDSNLNLLSTTVITTQPMDIAIYDDLLYTCSSDKIRQYIINSDYSLTLNQTYGTGCSASDTFHAERSIKLSKDGGYLGYLNYSTQSAAIINVTGTMDKIFTTPVYDCGITSQDFDVLNKRYYLAACDTNTGTTGTALIIQYNIQDLTQAWGEPGHNFPDGTNPFTNETLHPPTEQGTVNNTVNTEGGTLGSGTGNDFLTVIINGWATFFPTGIDGAKWFLGIMVVLWVMFGAYKVSESAMGTLIGGFLGVGLAVGIGLIPIWFIMAITFFIILLVSRRIFSSREGGDE